MMRRRVSAFLVFLFLLFIAVPLVFAHDGEWGTEETPLDFDWVGDGQTLDLEHYDLDPWKGWATLNVRNICGGDWGDFHLKIKGFNIANVDFVDDATHQPQLWLKQGGSWVQYTGLSWNIDNDVIGAELDMFFYDNPISHGEKARIRVYTDNTASRCSLFYVSAHATPVPEPATLALLGLGAISLIRRRKA